MKLLITLYQNLFTEPSALIPTLLATLIPCNVLANTVDYGIPTTHPVNSAINNYVNYYSIPFYVTTLTSFLRTFTYRQCTAAGWINAGLEYASTISKPINIFMHWSSSLFFFQFRITLCSCLSKSWILCMLAQLCLRMSNRLLWTRLFYATKWIGYQRRSILGVD